MDPKTINEEAFTTKQMAEHIAMMSMEKLNVSTSLSRLNSLAEHIQQYLNLCHRDGSKVVTG